MIRTYCFLCLLFAISTLKAQLIYVDGINGNDSNSGTEKLPLKTLLKAAEKVNNNSSNLSTEVIVGEGIYIIDSVVIFKPSIAYSTSNRFILRAEVLPGDTNWTPAKMPVILPTLSDLTNDQDGKWSNGIKVEVSHATIQGLKIMGSPIYEYIEKDKRIRSYPIVREGSHLEDLLITQCLFVGNEQILPLHMGIYAAGNKVIVDHCVFYKCKIGVLYVNYDSKETWGNSLTNNLFIGYYGTAAWIMNTSTDFIFEGNSIVNSNYAVILENGNTKKYKIKSGLFANNKQIIGNGDGALLNFSPLDISSLIIGSGVKISNKITEINLDQSKNDYLHILKDGLEVNKSGLFK